ncbi:hypothetical protein, partial [Ferrovum myxofaciens]|uniref:hypothetical protein n=1 Tax=Ferrovum myxofaciens TaxID=416213 RepID=UPI001D0D10EC
MGEVGLPGGFVVGSGLANKHSTMLPEKQGVLVNIAKYYGTTQRYRQKQKTRILYNQCIIEINSEKLSIFSLISLKAG